MESARTSWRKFVRILRSQIKATPRQQYDIHLCDWRGAIAGFFFLVAESDGFGRFSSAQFRVSAIVSGASPNELVEQIALLEHALVFTNQLYLVSRCQLANLKVSKNASLFSCTLCFLCHELMVSQVSSTGKAGLQMLHENSDS
jgi:hypothetical protein